MNKIIPIVILVLVVIAGVVGWRVYERLKPAEDAHRGGASTPVDVAPVGRREVRDVEVFTGTLHPRSQFIVAPRMPGRLETVTVDIGDTVKSGQLLATLDDAEYARAVEQAQAELDVAQAGVDECRSTLEMSQREYERVRTLRERKVASESELDNAAAQYKTAQAKEKVCLAQVAQRQAALQAAQVRLAYTRIAPEWPGAEATRVVGERFADPGETLRINDSILSLLDISVLTAAISVTERDYRKIHVGQGVVVTTDAWPGRTFEGHVSRVAPLLREASREARVEVEIGNADHALKPGMFVRAQIEFARHPDATVVPSDSIVRRNGGEGVFMADTAAGVARFQEVTTGIVDGRDTEIVEPKLSGLVVVLGQHLLEDGGAIRLPNSREPAARRPGAGPSPSGPQSSAAATAEVAHP